MVNLELVKLGPLDTVYQLPLLEYHPGYYCLVMVVPNSEILRYSIVQQILYIWPAILPVIFPFF